MNGCTNASWSCKAVSLHSLSLFLKEDEEDMKMSGLLIGKGWSLSSFQSSLSVSSLWRFLWRLSFVTPCSPVDDEDLDLVFVLEKFQSSVLHSRSTLLRHTFYTQCRFSSFNLGLGYILEMWMQLCQDPRTISQMEIWDDVSLSPFAKSFLMVHSSCSRGKALSSPAEILLCIQWIIWSLPSSLQVHIEKMNWSVPSVVLIIYFCSRHVSQIFWKLCQDLSSMEDANDPKGSVVISHDDDEEDVRG